MTRIDLSALAREFADAPVDAVATVRVQAWAGSGPASTVAGAGVVFSPRNEVIVRGDAPDRTVELPPTDGTFCYRWDVSMRSGTLKLATRYTLVPDSDDAVPFGELVQVLPGSLEPSDGGRAAWDLVRTDAEGFRDEAAESARLAAEAVDTPGRQGQDGASAYQLAVDAGFVGTEAQWRASLRGADGADPTPQSYANALAVAGPARDESAEIAGAVFSQRANVPDGFASLDAEARVRRESLPAALSDDALRDAYGSVTLLTEFGAQGDGVTDDTAAWNAAVAAVPPGGTLFIPHGTYVLPDVSMQRNDIDIAGPGTIRGRLTLGASGVTTDMMGHGVKGVRFARTGPVSDPTFAGIRLLNIKRARIESCWFYNMSSAIYAYSDVGCDVADNLIVGCCYDNVGYFYRGVTGAGAVWRSHADLTMALNYGKARITHVKIDSIDGLVAEANRMFFFGFAAQDSQKESHFDIGYSDWIFIEGNKLFESGLETIKLTDPGHFLVRGNSISWPTQRANTDAILITIGVGRVGDSTAPARTFTIGEVEGGVVSQWSRAVVGLDSNTVGGDFSKVLVKPIALERASGNPPSYYGGGTLGTPRRVRLGSTALAISPRTPEYNGELLGTVVDDIRGRATASERWLHSRAKEIALPSRDTTISSKTTLYILRDLNQQSTTTTALSGIIHLDMRNAGTLARTAAYVLLVGTSPDGTRSCQVLGAVGSYTNTTGGPTNAPAFTFTVEHNGTNIVLTATPISPTSGAFSYSAVAEGNLILG